MRPWRSLGSMSTPLSGKASPRALRQGVSQLGRARFRKAGMVGGSVMQDTRVGPMPDPRPIIHSKPHG